MLSPSPRSDADSIPPFWSTAAAYGALWGTVEITLGSFLHSLKVPFAGALLASIGAALLVAQRQVVPTRGLTIATALVAAMCKSLSPGGVILGPMIGITVEGLLIELALLASPRLIVSALLAGMLAALWSVFQKVIGQFLLYGATVFDLYGAAFKKANDWLGHEEAGGWIVATLLGLVALIGMAGAWFGWRVGREAAGRLGVES